MVDLPIVITEIQVKRGMGEEQRKPPFSVPTPV